MDEIFDKLKDLLNEWDGKCNYANCCRKCKFYIDMYGIDWYCLLEFAEVILEKSEN